MHIADCIDVEAAVLLARGCKDVTKADVQITYNLDTQLYAVRGLPASAEQNALLLVYAMGAQDQRNALGLDSVM